MNSVHGCCSQHSAGQGTGGDLVDYIGRLDVHHHVCLIYETAEELFATAAPFISIGLARGEKCLYIVDDIPLETFTRELERRGINTRTAVAAGALVLCGKDEAFLREGVFSPERMIGLLGELLESAKAEGYAALRAAGEMTWMVGPAPGAELVNECEKRLNTFLAEHDILALCLYNRRRIPTGVIMDALHSHPVVICGDTPCHNYFYVPPEETAPSSTAKPGVASLMADMVEKQLLEQLSRVLPHHQQKLLDAMFTAAPLGIWLLDGSGRMVFANRSCLQTFGVSEQAVFAAAHYSELMPPENAAGCMASDALAVSADGPVATRETFHMPDGSRQIHQVVKTRLTGPDGGVDGLLGFAIDITVQLEAETALKKARDDLERRVHERTEELNSANRDLQWEVSSRKEAEVRLRGSEERLRAICNTLPDLAFVIDDDGRYQEILANETQLLHRDVVKVKGRLLHDVHPAKMADLFLEKVRSALASGAIEIFEYQLEATEGTCYFEARLAPMRTSSGQKRRVVCLARDITCRRKAEEEIRALAYYDPLTGLPNRALLLDRLCQSLSRAERGKHLLALLFLDLDRFKDINDSRGHAVGDLLLQAVAKRLNECVRTGDTVARLGGDEFVLLLPCVDDPSDVVTVSEKVLDLLSSPFRLAGQEVFTSASIGIVLYPLDGSTPETLLKHADMAMYTAKGGGRNAFQFFSREMNRKALERAELELDLRKALQEKEFFVVYQPQYDARSGRIIGMEALLRWQHPQRGLVPVTSFIPVAEDTGLIRLIGEWVLRTACNQARKWQESGYPPLPMSVNLSGSQFMQPDFVAMVERVLEETGLEPRYLELELTETILMEAAETTLETLGLLKEHGLLLAIDDFGTGYSSLSYLKHFPIDRIKIDQSFVRGVNGDGDDAAIIEAIIAIAKSLRLSVIAEGVETVEQADFLQQKGCRDMQGYLFARPMSPEGMTEALAAFLGAK